MTNIRHILQRPKTIGRIINASIRKNENESISIEMLTSSSLDTIDTPELRQYSFTVKSDNTDNGYANEATLTEKLNPPLKQ